MEPHERLNRAMNKRRLELRLHWKQVASGAGISPESLGAIRRGEYRPSELTARGLDDTLGWQAGTVYQVLDHEHWEPVIRSPASGGTAPGETSGSEASLFESDTEDLIAKIRSDPAFAESILEFFRQAGRIAREDPPSNSGTSGRQAAG